MTANDTASGAIVNAQGSKRKLSASAPSSEDVKRTKTEEAASKFESTEISNRQDGTGGDNDEDQTKDEAVEESEEEEETRERLEYLLSEGIDTRDHKIDGPGPYTFFCYADGLMSILDSADENSKFWHKKSVLDGFKPASTLTEEARLEALDRYIDVVGVASWWVIVEDGARETPEAKKLYELWEKLDEEGERKPVEEKEDSSPDHWWWEVIAQREKPQAGEPAEEMFLEDDDRPWWIVGFKLADDDGSRAMTFLCDHFPTYD